MTFRVIRDIVTGPTTPTRDYGQLTTIAVHRTGWHTLELFKAHGYDPTPTSLAVMYAREAGISVWPYSFTVGLQGQVWQSHLLEAVTWHAKAFNVAALGVAVIGDFRFAPPTDPQYASLVELLAVLRRWNLLTIRGHAPELGPRATSASGKLCPGPLLDMAVLRRDVNTLIEARGADDLRRLGVAI